MPTFSQDLADSIWSGWEDVDALTQVTITTQTGDTIDHTTGEITPTVVSETPTALVSPFGPEEVDNIAITRLDRKVLIPVAELMTMPTLHSTVTFNGVTWSIKTPPETVANDGLWQLHVRQIGQV